MALKRIYAVFVRQIFLLRHNPMRFIGMFFWLAIDIVLWGFITKYLDSLKESTFSFTTVLFGAILLWEFLTRIQQGVMQAFFEDVWSKNFINFFGSPLRTTEYVIGLILFSIISGLIGFGFGIGLAGLAFGYNFFKIGLALLPFLLILFIFGVSLGIFTAAIVLRFGPSAEWIAWPLTAILSPLAGVFYPISVLPVPLQYLAKLLPPSYVFESLRAIIINHTPLNHLTAPLITGLIAALIFLLIMYWLFLAIYRLVLRRGLISRFSAETSS